VSVMPKDDYRYGYRLSVDDDTGFLLKSELLDRHGAPLEQIVYTALQLPQHIADDLLEPGISGQGFTGTSAMRHVQRNANHRGR